MQHKYTMELQNKRNRFTLQTLSAGLLVLYIVFSYISQETLLPTTIHSFVMYAFVGVTLLYAVLSGRLLISKFTIWQLFMILLSWLSLIWATEIEFSAIYTMLVSFVITFSFIFVVDTLKKIDLCAFSFIIGGDAMGLLIISTGQLSNPEDGERLGQTITGNANIFSALIMVACVFALWNVIYSRNFYIRLMCLASAIFHMVLMVFSGGRKTIVAVIVCLAWFVITKDLSKTTKLLKNFLFLIALLAVLIMLVMNVPWLYELIGVRFEGLLDLIWGGTSDVSSDETRATLIKIGLNKWIESPIWGYGIDAFKYYNKTVTGHFYYAHNNYVELLYDLGIIGFVLYYGFYLYLINALRIKRTENASYKSLGIALVLMILVYDMGGISFYSNLPLLVLAIAFSILMICSKAEGSQIHNGLIIRLRR